jgi:hypothetical protein
MTSQPRPMTGPRARAEAWLDRLLARPRIQRLDPYLGISELRRFNPLLALIPIGLMALLGARTSQFGHIDTVGGIFPIISLVSALNPFVGLLSGLAFGAADLVQKFIVDDVFYEGTKTTGDYWGARIGYLLGYSSLIVFGTLPGVLARVGARVGERVAARGAARSAALAHPAASVLRAGRAIGAAIGAAIGGVVAAGVSVAAGAGPFLMRPTPDHTCYALSRENIRAAIPLVMVAAAGGGAPVGSAIGSDAVVASDAVVGGGDDRTSDGCDALVARFKGGLEGFLKERRHAYDAVQALQRAQEALARSERSRVELVNEQQSALYLMLAAGGIAAAVASTLLVQLAGRMATYWAGRIAAANQAHAAALVSNAPGRVDTLIATSEFIAANEGKIAAWNAVAERGLAVGTTSGLTGGFGIGQLLERAMEEGLAEVNAAVEREQRTFDAMRDACIEQVANVNRTHREWAELYDRIMRQCPTHARSLEWNPRGALPLTVPERWRPPSATE